MSTTPDCGDLPEADAVSIAPTESADRGGSAPPKLSPQRGRVFDYMNTNPGATAKECASSIGMSVGSVRQQLGHLRSAGLIPGGDVRELSAQRAKVFEYMRAKPRATAKECAAATGLSFGSVRQHQFRLRTAGLIPLAPRRARRAGSLRSLIALHKQRIAMVRKELEEMTTGQVDVSLLLEPSQRRRHLARIRRWEARLRHHESRMVASLKMLIEAGSAS